MWNICVLSHTLICVLVGMPRRSLYLWCICISSCMSIYVSIGIHCHTYEGAPMQPLLSPLTRGLSCVDIPMCECAYTYLHIHRRTRTHNRTQTHTHTHTQTQTHTKTHTQKRTSICTHAYAHVHVQDDVGRRRSTTPTQRRRQQAQVLRERNQVLFALCV